MYRFIIVLASLLFFLQIDIAAAATYPWENDRQKNKSAEQKPGANYGKKNEKLLRFGPFVVKQQKNWVHRIDPDEGEMLVLIENGNVTAAIVYKDILEDTNHREFEPSIVKNVEHRDKSRVSVAGKKDVLCLRDETDEGETIFHIYPYRDNKTMYWIYVVEKEIRQELRPEVSRILGSLRFAR